MIGDEMNTYKALERSLLGCEGKRSRRRDGRLNFRLLPSVTGGLTKSLVEV